MKNVMTFFILFLTVFLFTQCKKDTLPDVTTSGQGSFGCRVDGQLWTPKKRPGSTGILNADSPTDARYGEVTKLLAIKASHFYSSTDYESIGISIFGPIEEKVYSLNTGTSPLTGFSCIDYVIDTTVIAQLEILRFDEEERIVAGTFEFTAIGLDNCTDTIKITDGRFDLYYRF